MLDNTGTALRRRGLWSSRGYVAFRCALLFTSGMLLLTMTLLRFRAYSSLACACCSALQQRRDRERKSVPQRAAEAHDGADLQDLLECPRMYLTPHTRVTSRPQRTRRRSRRLHVRQSWRSWCQWKGCVLPVRTRQCETCLCEHRLLLFPDTILSRVLAPPTRASASLNATMCWETTSWRCVCADEP